MASVMHLHIGGAGAKIGDLLWRLYEKEKVNVQKLNYIYTEDKNSDYSPNVLFADLDNEIVDKIKSKKQNNFRDKSFVKGKEDAANIYSKGYYTSGKAIIDQSLESIRQQIEGMDYLDQFIITSSISGGSGSGFSSLLLERLSCEYPKKQKFAFLIYPSQNQSNSIVDVYNSVLSTNMTLNHCDSVTLFDNESMYKVIDQYLDLDFIDYEQINNIVSQVISSYTGIQRFNWISNKQIFNNLTPHPRIHYITPSYGPLISINDYSSKSKCLFNQKNLKEVVDKKFKLYQCQADPLNLFSTVINRQLEENTFYGQSCSTLQNIQHYYETKTQVYQCLAKNYQVVPEISEVEQTNTFLSNDAVVLKRFEALAHKYESIYEKQGFVHWYVGEGCDFDEMQESREILAALCKDYDFYYMPEHHDCDDEFDQD